MRYFVTVVFQDEAQPLLQRYYNTEVEIDNIAELGVHSILAEVQSVDRYIRHKDIAIVFMMALK